jgi:NADH-quinone oxidoreductase subunit L
VGQAWAFAGLSAGVAGLGIAVAWLFYGGSMKHIPGQLAKRLAGVHRVVFNKFYVDELYDLIVVRPFRAVADVCYRVFDVLIIDSGLVHGVAGIASAVGGFIRGFHNGDLQQYAVAVVVGVAALIWYVGG